MKTIHVLNLALALLLITAGLALAGDAIERPRQVLGSGASEPGDQGLSLQGTLGQPVVGSVSAPGAAGDITLGNGFWRGGAYHTYLPSLLRDFP